MGDRYARAEAYIDENNHMVEKLRFDKYETDRYYLFSFTDSILTQWEEEIYASLPQPKPQPATNKE